MQSLPELACPKIPQCTLLLEDPAGVLSDTRLNPLHLCYELLLLESTYKWARQVTTFSGGVSVVSEWRQKYPLPIGKEAVNRTAPYAPEVYEAIPFDGDEKALWALRIERGNDELDLFGLAEYGSDGLRTGEIRFSLRGQGTELVDTVKQAQRWWAKFRGRRVGGDAY
jgi:hypothetical protein